MSLKLNEKDVLQSFYEERKNRIKTPKHHSLLRKNLSYFSNKEEPKDNSIIYHPKDSKKQKLRNSKRNYEVKFEQIDDKISKYSQSNKLVSENNYTNIVKDKQNQCNNKTEKTQHFKQELLEQYYSPTFKMLQQSSQVKLPQLSNELSRYLDYNSRNNDDEIEQLVENINIKNNKNYDFESDSNNFQLHNLKINDDQLKRFKNVQKRVKSGDQSTEIKYLQAKIKKLEKQNRKQTKFIESISKMQKAVQKVENDCSLKDLWRWLKTLPQIQQHSYQ